MRQYGSVAIVHIAKNGHNGMIQGFGLEFVNCEIQPQMWKTTQTTNKTMTLVKFNPTAPFFGRNFFDDETAKKLFQGYGRHNQHNDFGPNTKVREEADKVVVEMALPGISRNQIKITVNGDELAIRYEHNKEDANSAFVNSFTKKFTLSDAIDLENVNSRLTDGILRITLGKKAEAQPTPSREINIG